MRKCAKRAESDMRLIWFGKPRFWALNTKTLKETGCKAKIGDLTHFDLHIESPCYDIDNRRFVSTMINVEGFQPDDTSMFPHLNLNPIYKTLDEIPFDIYKVVYLETSSFSEITMHDCIWIHYFMKDTNIQIVPNKIEFFAELFEFGLKDLISRWF